MQVDPGTSLAALFDAAPEADSTPAARLALAAQRARAGGLAVLELGLQPPMESGEAAALVAAIALQGVRFGRAATPTVILGGGPVLLEGRPADAATLLLRLALSLDEHPAIHAWAAGGAAAQGPGASVAMAPDLLARARRLKLEPGPALAANGARDFFAALGALGPAPPWPDGIDVLRAVLLT